MALPVANRRRLPILAAAIFILHSATGFAAESQGWMNHALSLGLNPAWRAKITQELRTREVAYDETFLQNWSVGLFRNLPRNTYVGASYKRESEEKVSLTTTENRFTLEGGWARGLASGFSFDTRLRTEFRNFESDLSDDHVRIRLRLRLRKRLQIRYLELTPFGSTELFDRTNREQAVDRNRFALGVAVGIHDHVDFVVNYLRQDTDDQETVNVLNSGFELSF